MSADEVVIVPGGKVTFYFACLLFGGPGAEILYPDPGFPPYREAIRSGGAKGVPYPIREEKDFGFDADEVLSLITPAHPPHHDQFARQSDRRRRRRAARSPKLAKGLMKHPDVAVLSDEIYSHLVFQGAEFTSFLAFPGTARPHHHPRWLVEDLRHDRLAAGLRHLAEGAGRSCEEAHHRRSFLRQCCGPDGGACRDDRARWTRSKASARASRSAGKIVVDGLNALPGVSCRMPGGAFYAFPNVKATGRASRDLARDLLEEGACGADSGREFRRQRRGLFASVLCGERGRAPRSPGADEELSSVRFEPIPIGKKGPCRTRTLRG